MGYFVDDKGIIKEKFVNHEAEEQAKKFITHRGFDPRTKEPRIDKNNSINTAQLRKFFNEFKALERKFIEKRDSAGLEEEESYNFIHPMVKLTRAKAEYAKGRKLLPSTFLNWFTNCVNNINNAQEFKAFLLHFEAIVGYCYGAGLKD